MSWLVTAASAMPSPKEHYLRELRALLRGNPFLARRVIRELDAHLDDAIEAARRSGMSIEDAEADAVRHLGPANQFAVLFDRFSLPSRVMLGFMSMSSIAVAGWLCWVIAYILPRRDPGHVFMWQIVAVSFVGYSLLCIGALIVGARFATMRRLVLVLSFLAVSVGMYGMVTMILRGIAGEEFEGYIVLMGLILSAHGACGILYAILEHRLERRVRDARGIK